LWEKLQKSIKQAATNTLGFKERKKPKKLFSDRCKRAIEERDAVRIVNFNKNP